MKATLKDVVLGTPAGNKAVKKALKKIVRRPSKVIKEGKKW